MSHIVINKDKCKACYLCIKVVEFNDPNHECLGCAMCATRCPDLAITEVYKD